MVESVAAAAFSSDGEYGSSYLKVTVIQDALFYAAFWLKLKAFKLLVLILWTTLLSV